MLRLDPSHVRTSEVKGGDSSRYMSAVFDDVTKTGKVKTKHSQRFVIRDGVLTLNGVKHDITDAIDMRAEPERLIAYFNALFNSTQLDIFLEPPLASGDRLPMLVKDLRWEYPDLAWRAVDKAGTVAYFNSRPKLDNAGYWVSVIEGVTARYGTSICFADNYASSVQNINDKR